MSYNYSISHSTKETFDNLFKVYFFSLTVCINTKKRFVQINTTEQIKYENTKIKLRQSLVKAQYTIIQSIIKIIN